MPEGGFWGYLVAVSPRNTFKGNAASMNTSAGFQTEVGSAGNSFTDNYAISGAAGFQMNAKVTSMRGNAAHDNQQFGFVDAGESDPDVYVDNTCLRNGNGGSWPPGLCSVTPTAEEVATPDEADQSG